MLENLGDRIQKAGYRKFEEKSIDIICSVTDEKVLQITRKCRHSTEDVMSMGRPIKKQCYENIKEVNDRHPS